MNILPNWKKLNVKILFISKEIARDEIIGHPEIQKFAGALQGQRAKKGIFITTGNLCREVKEYVNKIDSKIVLIDGKQLTEYTIGKNYRSNFRKVLFHKEIRPRLFWRKNRIEIIE